MPSFLLLATLPAEALATIRQDLPAAAIGFLLLGVGLAAGAVAWARRRTGDPTLLYFSAVCSLYAVRLLIDADATEVLFSPPYPAWDKLINVLSYFIPVPGFLFFERVLGPGRRSSMRRMGQLLAILAVVAIPVEIVSPSPGALLGPYRFLVIAAVLVTIFNLFAPGQERSPDLRLLRTSFLVFGLFALYENLRGMGLTPWRQNVEPLGFLLFVGGLGAIAARRVFAAQERLSAIRQELETARRIQAATLPQETPRIAGLDLAARYVPASEVAGDFYDFLPGESRRLGIFVADVSGHGVPAALVASMLKVAVAAQAAHAASPARVLSEVNQIFHGKLKNQFITALYVHLDLEAARLTWASAGHPPPLLWRKRDGRVEELAHGGLVLGRLRRAAYTEASVAVEPGDRLLLFTDGIPEAASPAGEPFGDERLRAFLADHAGLSAEGIAETLLAKVSEWTGRSAGFADDLTLVVAGIEGEGPLSGPSPG
ncbi:MAG TPA: SpoIIE family protein phosphatase [Thermoanaerobaculia bacterium]|jgi:sigma-B regulation protein RsbU (phosphoserine phosphatase)